MYKKITVCLSIALVLGLTTVVFAAGPQWVSTFNITSGTYSAQQVVIPVWSGAPNKISATLDVQEIANGTLTTNYSTNGWTGLEVGSQNLTATGFHTPSGPTDYGMTYVVDYSQVSNHPFTATTNTQGNYQATIDDSWNRSGRQDAGTGAHIAVNGGGWVETELNWAQSTSYPGTAHAELLVNNASDTGYVEMRTNTGDYGNVTGNTATKFRAFGEVAASGNGGFNIWGQTGANPSNTMDYKVVGTADGVTDVTTRADNAHGFVQDSGNFSTGLDIENNQTIVKAYAGLITESVGFDIDFKATASEHYNAYVAPPPW